MLAVGLGTLAILESVNHMVLDRQPVQRQQVLEVPVVEHSPWWQKSRSVKFEIDGVRINLEHGQLDADGSAVGSRLGVVVDPMDSNHVIAVEQPEYWNEPAGDMLIGAALISAFVLYASVMVGWLFLGPEIRAWLENRRSLRQVRNAVAP